MNELRIILLFITLLLACNLLLVLCIFIKVTDIHEKLWRSVRADERVEKILEKIELLKELGND